MTVPAASLAVPLTADSFTTLTGPDHRPIVVEFWAPWCPPCRVLAPLLDQLAGEYSGQITVAKLNVDEYGQVADQLSVASIPTLIFFAHGEEVERLVGAPTRADLEARLQSLLAPAGQQ